MEQRDSIDFRDTAVRKLFMRFLLPTVLGMVSSAIFIVTDGIFVGRGIGGDALAAVNLVAPIYTLATGFGLMFGMGCSVVASVNLARGKQRVAKINITQALTIPVLLTIVASIVLIIGDQTTLRLLGTPDSLNVPAREYLLWFTPFLASIALFDIVMFCVRLDGAPRLVMYCNIGAAVLNIILDWLFIFVFKWGLAGAAVATGIGYTLGALVMLWYMLRRSRTLRPAPLKLSPRSLRLTMRNIGYMSYVGFSALLSELAISCMMVAGNYAFIRYVGKDGVAAYSIACYLFPIIFMIYSGIIQAAQPIISYNYGAGINARATKAFRMALIAAAGFGLVTCIATQFSSSLLVGLFLPPDIPAHAIAAQGLRWFAWGYIFFGVNVVTMGYLQSIELGKAAAAMTALRGIVLMIIFFIILPRLWGEPGIWFAVPAAEGVTTLLLLGIYGVRRYQKRRV